MNYDFVTLALIIFGFLLGMMPFSVWLARRSSGADLQKVGDGNPGATNAWRAAGWQVGLASYILDVGKAALPVGLAAHVAGLGGPGLWAVALAPTLGHIFSPLLHWRGGKGLATILGVWVGLSLWEMPLVILACLALFKRLVRSDAWAVLFTEIFSLLYLLVRHLPPAWAAVFVCQILLTVWTHRAGFASSPASS